MNRLQGKVCVVTAAGQGIGRAIAESLHREGAKLVIAADLNRSSLDAWVKGDRLKAVTLDATDETAVQQLASTHPETSVLINCVGIVTEGSVLDASVTEMERVFRINVISTQIMIRSFLPAMRARRDGSIVNIASVVSSVKGVQNRFVYGTTKAAIIGLTKSVARDFIADGIRCNAISPGTVESPSLHERMAAKGDFDKARAEFVARQPMGRLGVPQEIAAVATMLASAEAAYMTGENIIIDGGMSL